MSVIFNSGATSAGVDDNRIKPITRYFTAPSLNIFFSKSMAFAPSFPCDEYRPGTPAPGNHHIDTETCQKANGGIVNVCVQQPFVHSLSSAPHAFSAPLWR